MTQKENAHPSQAEMSAHNTRNSKPQLTPRQHRALVALVHAQDWIAREALDQIARASNGPAVVQALRHKLGGHDAIEMQRVPVIDADGQPCKPGYYALSPLGRERAVALLEARP